MSYTPEQVQTLRRLAVEALTSAGNSSPTAAQIVERMRITTLDGKSPKADGTPDMEAKLAELRGTCST